MKLRNILIIHSKTISTILKNYILAELTDSSITIVNSVEEGGIALNSARFDIVLCGKEISLSNELNEFMKLREKHGGIPFIVVTSNNTSQNIQELIHLGFRDYLVSPFTAAELGAKINSVCLPRQWRKHERVHIPGARVILGFDKQVVQAEIVNISIAGLLCDFQYRNNLNCMQTCSATILVPDEFNIRKLENIRCKYFRSVVLSWDADHSPDIMRVVLNFIGLEPKTAEALDQVMKKTAGSTGQSLQDF